MAISGKCTGRRAFGSLRGQASEAQFEKGNEPEKEIESEKRTVHGERRGQGEEESKVNEEKRAREGGSRRRERDRALFLCTAWPALHAATSQGHCTPHDVTVAQRHRPIGSSH